jgi:hypothetical protein
VGTQRIHKVGKREQKGITYLQAGTLKGCRIWNTFANAVKIWKKLTASDKWHEHLEM